MKANELMIGDWIKLNNSPEYYKVYGIEIMSRGDACRLKNDEYNTDSWCDRICPIPLTEDILKANGFKCRKTNACPRYSLIDNIGHKLISFLRDNTGYEIQVGGNRVRLNYVHELQHALRLCGLNELADNFKLE